ncbi:acyl transferase/acyl hydrolase/lysophospholipase [Obelidium mucronatum]|nr:acyl transferase/acyl hydrolase/lysophospholipase [Obelidium mucronatum]
MNHFSTKIKDALPVLPPELARLHERLRSAVLQRVAALKAAAVQLDARSELPPRPRAAAAVRPAAQLGAREAACAAARAESHVRPQLQRVLARRRHARCAADSKLPVVGIAASGGGTRAMVATLASLKAMHQLGLLDCCQYMAGVSGSTWAMAHLYNYPQRLPSDALRSARYSLSKNFLLNPIETVPKVALATAIERIKTAKKVNLVDLFGVLLTAAILEGVGGTSSIPKISDQALVAELGLLPFPIYSAVTFSADDDSLSSSTSNSKEKYQWVEFNPFEMGFLSAHSPNHDGVWIPMDSFGRHFYAGEAVSNDPEVSFGILLGVFGSAFTANLHRILQELGPDIPPELLIQAKKVLKSKLDTTHPISPAVFPNPAYKLDSFNDPITNKPEIPLMDSGMDNSIPFAPLLNPAREVDILIVLDASADIGLHPFLERVNQFMENRGCSSVLFPNSRQECKYVSKDHMLPFSARDAGMDGRIKKPEVVYLPLVGDAAKAWYAKAGNFLWSEGQVDSISSLAASHISESKDEIENLIIKVWEKKNGFSQ